MKNIQQIKRYQIAKVYRRDQPAMTRGRYREFYQCDFDIAGIYDAMIPDAEILRVIVEIFKALELPITIKLNHRRILDGLFAVCGVPEEKMRSISSAVDKLDKLPWPLVKKEMVEEKGLAEEVADRIGVYVQRSGSLDSILQFLKSDAELSANPDIKAGLADLDLLLPYSRAMKVYENISFDLSLARGLDYYSGLIYEVVLSDPASQVGSIAAGGRYDNLVGMYGKRAIPCVGVSFGVDRIFTLLSTRQQKSAGRDIDVFIVAIGEGFLLQRMEVVGLLWEAGIKAEFSAKVKPRVQQQFAACEGVAVVVMLGKAEWESGCVRVKAWRDEVEEEEEEDRGQLVAREDLVKEVRRLLSERE
jgi:histidyl-tRNA synthetase